MLSLGTIAVVPAVTAQAAVTSADFPIAIDAAHFPDAKFLSFVKSTYDTSGNSKLEWAEVSGVTSLTASNKGLTSLTGISYFPNLTTLNVNTNSLTSIDISGLTKLLVLNVSNNKLASLNLTAAKLLTTVQADRNLLTSITFTGLTKLTSLDVSQNKLTSLDARALSALIVLDASSNSLTSVTVTSMSHLESLTLSDNNLSSISLSGLGDLLDLDLDYNNFTTISFSGAGDLEGVSISYNKLTALNVSSLDDLETLYCDYNQLTSLSISGTVLRYLSARGNQLLDVTGVNSLDEFSGDASDQAVVIPVTLKSGSTTQYVSGTSYTARILKLATGTTYSSSAKQFTTTKLNSPVLFQSGYSADEVFTSGTITFTNASVPNTTCPLALDAAHFPDAKLLAIVKSDFDANSDNSLSCAELRAANNLGAANASITNTSGLQYLPYLSSVTLSSNTGLTSVNLSGLPVLQSAYIQNAGLTSINVSGLLYLEELYLAGNSLASINLSGLTSLGLLDLTGNQLTALSVTGNPLGYLGVKNNHLYTVTGLDASTSAYSYYSKYEGSGQTLTIPVKLQSGTTYVSESAYKGITSISGTGVSYNSSTGLFTTTKLGQAATFTTNIASKSIYGDVLSLTGAITFEVKGVDPQGGVNNIEARPGAIWVRGWAADADVPTTPIQVKVSIGGVLGASGAETHTLTANLQRTDIPRTYPQFGEYHGFNATLTTSKQGTQNVYFYAVNASGTGGNDVLLATRSITLGNNPQGAVNNLEVKPGAVWVRGWAADADAPTTPLQVKVSIGGVLGASGAETHTLTANLQRTDIPRTYPQFGEYHGFNSTLTTTKRGSQTVYVYAINASGTGGADKLLGSQTIQLGYDPQGALNNLEAKSGAVWVRGWAADNDAPTAALQVKVVIGGTLGTSGTEVHVLTANLQRTDIPRTYPQFGEYHGYNSTITTTKRGTQTVYVYALNATGTPGVETKLLGSGTITLGNNPQGGINNVEARPGAVWVRGWAADADAPTTPINVKVSIGGPIGGSGVQTFTLTANLQRTDIPRTYPQFGEYHGFNVTLSTTKRGSQTIYFYAINAVGTSGTDTLLGTRTVSITN